MNSHDNDVVVFLFDRKNAACMRPNVSCETIRYRSLKIEPDFYFATAVPSGTARAMSLLTTHNIRHALVMTLVLCVAVFAPEDAMADSDSSTKLVSQQNAEDVDHNDGHKSKRELLTVKLNSGPSNSSALFPWVTDDKNWLQRHGLLVVFDNINEFMGAITKPTPGIPNLRQGSSNAGQYAVSVTTDWSRLAGIKGLGSRFVVVGRYGTPANRMFGDWLAHSSETYGGGGNVVVRFVMGYFEEHLLQDRLSIAAGRMAQLSDFATSTMFCNFVNNSFCGRPRAAGDSAYATTWPVSVWATRVRVRPVSGVYIQAGVYFTEDGLYGVQQNRSGWTLNGANIAGQVFPIETGWEPSFGSHKRLTGHYKIGVSIENVRRYRPYATQQSAELGAGTFSAGGRRGAWSVWMLADQRIIAFRGRDEKAGVSVMAGALVNDPTISLRQQQYYGGLVTRGFWRWRPADSIGVAASWTKIAEGVQRAEERFLQTGQSLPFNATGIQRNAFVFEAYYTFRVGRAVTIQPDFQYYLHPNGQQNLRDAAMLGFRSHVEIF
ncbi:carbohydrate porin [Neokomagataea tanensis]|nr:MULTISPECIES: carbohydrate porin [Neokomagataea]